MFEIITYLQFLTFIAGISIAIYVFVRNPKDGLHQALALAALGMAGWNLSVFLVINEVVNLAFGVASSFAWATWMTIGFTWFIYQFPGKIRHYRTFTTGTLLLGVFLFLLAYTPGFVQGVEVLEGYADITFNDSLYSLWSLFFIGNFLYTAALIVIRAFRAHGVDRARLMQLLLGFFFFFIPSMSSNLLLPLLLNDFRWNNFGPVFSLFLIFFLLNAVTRYRLLDIKWILGKSFFISLIIGGIVGVVGSIVFIASDVFNAEIGFIIGAFVVAIFIKPVWEFLERVFSRVINFGGYEPGAATEELFNIVRTEGELGLLVDKLLERFAKYFAAEEAAIIIYQPDSTKIAMGKCKGYKKLCSQRSATELGRLAKQLDLQILEKNELIWLQRFGKSRNGLKKKEQKVLKEMEKSGIETLVPLIVDSHLAGLLILGKRGYDRSLRSSDINFLELVRSGISPALENAAKFEQIKKLYDRLTELDKAKSEFINIVSHRFRTPLSAIRWNLETVLDVYRSRIGKEVTEALTDSQDRTLFLVETLDRLFDSLAIESGKLKLHTDVFDTKDAFETVIKEYKKRCKDHGIKCVTKVESFTAWGDKQRLASILRSITSNALQYTKEGGKISVHVVKEGDRMVFEVTDTGIGIPPAAKKKIYEKFYRAKNAVLTYADGQGLGMFYTKEITDMHGGKIHVDSTLNKGTKVRIEIPIKKTAKK